MKNVKIEMKWALLFNCIVVLWMLLEKLLGFHDKYIDYQMYVTNFFAIPAIITMVFAINNKKKQYYNGIMKYKQGLKSGVILSVFIAILTPISQWVTTYIISPSYFPNMIKRSVALGYYPSEIDAKAYFNYYNYTIQGTIGALVMGIVTTAIAVIFLHSKKKKQTNF